MKKAQGTAAINTIKEQVTNAMKDAMRAQDKRRLGVIRLITAAFKQAEVDERVEITDDIALKIIDKMVKLARESLKQFEEAGRDDLVENQAYEITIFQEFLPAALSIDEIKLIITEAVNESGATTIKDMGKVMGLIRPKLQGRADMGEVGNIIKNMLSA